MIFFSPNTQLVFSAATGGHPVCPEQRTGVHPTAFGWSTPELEPLEDREMRNGSWGKSSIFEFVIVEDRNFYAKAFTQHTIVSAGLMRHDFFCCRNLKKTPCEKELDWGTPSSPESIDVKKNTIPFQP